MLHPDLVSATAKLRVLSAKGVDSLQVPCRFGEPALTLFWLVYPATAVGVLIRPLLWQFLELFEHRHHLLLIVGRLRDRLLHHQQAVRFDRRLRVVGLLEAAVVRDYSITRLDGHRTKCGIINR